MRTYTLLALASAALAMGCQDAPTAVTPHADGGGTITDGGGTVTDGGSPTDTGAPPSDGAVSTDDDPTHVHLNWSDDPSTTIAVVWSTTMNTVNGSVAYGTSPTALTQTAMSTVNTAGTGANQVTVHESHITGLTPSTTYYYQVGTAGHMSPVNHFKTGPAAGDAHADVNFVVTGDSRDDTAIWRAVQDTISSTLTANPPDFEVFTGDAVPLGTIQSSWNGWFDAAAHNLANMPWILAHGNHDAMAVNFLAQFAQPTVPAGNNKVYFSLNVGPIHFVVLNDTPPNLDNSIITGTESNFLTSDLMAVDRTRTPWVIAVHHKPPYSSSTHHADADVALVRSSWTPIYDRFHVDLVLNGHDHDLEVTRPINAGSATTATMGTTYITAAGAGAMLYPSATSPWTLYSEMTVNFLAIHATPTLLDVHAYRMNGTEIAPAHVQFTH